MADDDEDFEELRALRAEIEGRHRRLVRVLIGAGVALIIAGGVLAAFIDLTRRPGMIFVPVGLSGFGLAAIARAMYSALTDVDTRPDPQLVGVADPIADDADDADSEEEHDG